MKTLVLGGTTFLGRHLIGALTERGHEPAIFTRGKTHGNETLALTRYVGDRDGGLDAILRNGWDAVIDTSGYVPAIVAASCAHLVTAGRHLFTSSFVLPLSAVPKAAFDPLVCTAFLLDHAFFVGLPIALALKPYAR